MPVKIFIGNLTTDIESDDLRVLFEKYGAIKECDVVKNFGFVHMFDKQAADQAIAELDGYNVKGQNIRVELSAGGSKGGGGGDSRGRGRGRGRGGGDRGGFGGGGRGEMGRSRPYPPPGGRGGRRPPPGYDPYDQYSAYERDPYYGDDYVSPRALAIARERLLRERALEESLDRLMPPRDRLAGLYPEERAALARLRAADRLPPASGDRLSPADPFYRARDPLAAAARPPPDYYDRKASALRPPGVDDLNGGGAGSRLSALAGSGLDYPPRRTAADSALSSSYGLGSSAGASSQQDYYGGRPGLSAGGYGAGAGGASQPATSTGQGNYDSQGSLQTQPIFF